MPNNSETSTIKVKCYFCGEVLDEYPQYDPRVPHYSTTDIEGHEHNCPNQED